jgi:peptidyl-prolyl cis-trans isomerase A (cyclophilin A)
MQHVKVLAALVTGFACTAASAEPWVSMKTSAGEIVLELNKEKAPISVANFVSYAKAGFYNGTVFHRVIDGFMIQGGGYGPDLKPKAGVKKAIKNESTNGLSNEPYTISMAREAHPDTATSQWFINVVHNVGLDHPNMKGSGYAVFGKVVKGKEVVDKIRKVVVDDVKTFQNVPVVPITVKTVTILKSAPAGIEVPAPAPEPTPAPAPAPATPPAEQPAQPVQ